MKFKIQEKVLQNEVVTNDNSNKAISQTRVNWDS